MAQDDALLAFDGTTSSESTATIYSRSPRSGSRKEGGKEGGGGGTRQRAEEEKEKIEGEGRGRDSERQTGISSIFNYYQRGKERGGGGGRGEEETTELGQSSSRGKKEGQGLIPPLSN